MFLLKKLIAVFLSLCFCLCLFAPVCFADNSVASDHTHNWVKQKIHSYSLEYNGIAFGIDVYKCSDCVLYLHKMLFLGYEVPIVRASPDTALGSEAAAMCAQALIAVFGKEWYATKFEAGGGSASPGGVGRNPAGYVGQGTPSVSYEGNNIYKLEPYFWTSVDSNQTYYPAACPQWENFPILNIDDYPDVSFSNSTLSFYNSHTNRYFGVVYGMYAPVAGKYSIYKNPDVAQFTCTYRDEPLGPWSLKYNYVTAYKHSNFDAYVKAGYPLYWQFSNDLVRAEYYKKFKMSASSLYVYCEPSQSTLIQQNNIIINNNTWNGNIYVDNSTNLTYIYPQYTTINENNETVTNISNNPIIYNNATKQYYTYDSVTNNYYYITYNAPTPTPTPDPTPTPSPDVPPTPIVPETQNLIVPKMNANSFTDEHGTWVASGSSKYSDVFDFFHAFDRSTSDFWETNVSPCHLQIEIPDPESYYIDGYIMRISKFNNRYSKDWTLQGSDDGETWDDLDKQTNQNLSDMEEHKYSLTLRKAYKYYRLNMSNYASSMCSLSHFNLLGYAAKDVIFPTPDPDKPTPSPSPGGPGGGDTPSGGGSNWWDKLLDDILSGLLEGVKGILKLLFDLFSSILGWIIWLCSKVFDLFPFLPPGAGALLVGGVVVCFILAFIKFIRG